MLTKYMILWKSKKGRSLDWPMRGVVVQSGPRKGDCTCISPEGNTFFKMDSHPLRHQAILTQEYYEVIRVPDNAY